MVYRHRPRASRKVPVPVELLAFVATLDLEAARRLDHIGRTAIYAALATGLAQPGTLSLFREAMARRGVQA